MSVLPFGTNTDPKPNPLQDSLHLEKRNSFQRTIKHPERPNQNIGEPNRAGRRKQVARKSPRLTKEHLHMKHKQKRRGIRKIVRLSRRINRKR